MYLGRCELNPNRRGAKSFLDLLRPCMRQYFRVFQIKVSEAGRVLWRIDRTDSGVFVYIVAGLAPDWSSLEEQGG